MMGAPLPIQNPAKSQYMLFAGCPQASNMYYDFAVLWFGKETPIKHSHPPHHTYVKLFFYSCFVITTGPVCTPILPIKGLGFEHPHPPHHTYVSFFSFFVFPRVPPSGTSKVRSVQESLG